uniref:Fish-egg lectin-like n=1 Tax=Cyprinus carpio TaxID=7962 RepID=A0A8C2FTT2_CYPCA
MGWEIKCKNVLYIFKGKESCLRRGEGSDLSFRVVYSPTSIVGVTPLDDVFCLNKDANNIGAYSNFPWTQLPGKLKYYSCGPYSCWVVNAAGNIIIRRVRIENRCDHALGESMSMVDVETDGSVFAVDTQGVGVTISNPPGSSWTNIVICLNGHKHVTFDLGRLYVICSDGSIMRCI